MNAYWQTCQADDHPATCGVLRERAERGFRLVVGNGEIGAGTMFGGDSPDPSRSEEHTSELQSLMRISYAVFCLKKKNTNSLLKTPLCVTSGHTECPN